jgi:hypothetical protein
MLLLFANLDGQVPTRITRPKWRSVSLVDLARLLFCLMVRKGGRTLGTGWPTPACVSEAQYAEQDRVTGPH